MYVCNLTNEILKHDRENFVGLTICKKQGMKVFSFTYFIIYGATHKVMYILIAHIGYILVFEDGQFEYCRCLSYSGL